MNYISRYGAKYYLYTHKFHYTRNYWCTEISTAPDFVLFYFRRQYPE
ncbi:hypothetical protein [Chryseobacterium oleae]|nr:hypothetical protein [Chryseobacterium oleae]